ncbi:cellulose biosynthesis protein BcsS [Methylobacterium sp. A54F]
MAPSRTLALLLVAAGPAHASEGLDALVFGGLDAAASAFVSGGGKLALDGLDRTGPVALVSAGAGRRGARRVCVCGRIATFARITAAGAALAGYQWVQDWGVVAAYAGPEAAAEALTEGRSLVLTGPVRLGLRLHGEIWARPGADTLVQGTVILGSARRDAWARLAYGVRLWETYLGPEVAVSADSTGYAKWSLGLHATDFAFGRFAFRASAGLQVETGARRPGPYVALSAWTNL